MFSEVPRLDRVLVLCPDWTFPAGSVRKLYRHVDVLNGNGIDAMIVHQNSGFRCRWFENQTPVTYLEAVWPPRATDILLIPESISAQIVPVTRGVRKVILNQNAYQTFIGDTSGAQRAVVPRRDLDVLATLVVSEDSRRYLEYIFPGHPIHRIHNSVDPALFHYQAQKQRRIVFMPRKKKDDAVQVLNMLRMRGALEGFEVVAVSNQNERETAKILRESMLFMSLCTYEGSPMPPLEAMACGCLTVGYHGRGGAEYVNEFYAFPVEPEDVLGFAQTMEQVLGRIRENPVPLLEQGRQASEFVLAKYTPELEEEDILTAWRSILGSEHVQQWHGRNAPGFSQSAPARSASYTPISTRLL